MIKTVLLVTLIVPGQPPHTFQVMDMTKLYCDVAKTALEKEYSRVFAKQQATYSIICIDRTIENR